MTWRDVLWAFVWGFPAGIIGGLWWSGRERRAAAARHRVEMAAAERAAVVRWMREPGDGEAVG